MAHQALKDLNIATGDLLIFTDIDELVRKPVLKMLRFCEVLPEHMPMRIALRHYQYSFEVYLKRVMRYGTLKRVVRRMVWYFEDVGVVL